MRERDKGSDGARDDEDTPTRRRDERVDPPESLAADTATVRGRTLGEEGTGTFSAGEILAERFRVLRFIAHGGMGEVYEAEDLELRERVALKTIRPSIARSWESAERFRREIHLARKVTHENVCRIFDLFRHPLSGGRGDVVFLTMELLSGETLTRRLKRTGPMDAQDALPFLEQMAAALDAAHRAGVVHRDFKPDNVIVVDHADSLRVVVTDFGLSRSQELDVAAESVTGTGVIVGTPAYMSPEQVEGQEITAASDVYSLGLVAYEMVTGKRPFADSSPLVNVAARVKETPTPPRKHAPQLSWRWESAILRCLDRNPQNRFPSAPAVIEALRRDTAGKTTRATTRAILGAAFLLMMLGAGLYWWMMNREGTTNGPLPDVSAVSPRRAVAVLGFQNLSGNPDVAWISTALSEMLGSELADGDDLRVVPGELVAQMRNDLSIPDGESFDQQALKRVRAHLNVDFVLSGSYVALGDSASQIRLDLRLQETAGAEIVGSARGAGPMDGLFELVSRVGASLREQAGLAPASGNLDRSSVLPSSTKAAKLYSEGLAKFRSFEYLQARSLLEAALEADPKDPLIQTLLAQTWWELGYTGRARNLATEAYEGSTELPLEERLLIEARYRSYLGSTKERERAASIYATLWSSFPDEIEDGLLLADAQPSVEALETVEQMKKLPPPTASDPRIFLIEAELHADLGDPTSALKAAKHAAQEAQARNARLMLAEALLLQGESQRQLGDIEEARETLEGARALYVAAGNPIGTVRTLRETARTYTGVDPAAVRRPISEAVALSRELGALPQAAGALAWLAQVAANEGDFVEAEELLAQAGGIWEEVGDDIDIASNLGTKSFVLSLKGDLRAAEEAVREALKRLRIAGDEETVRHAYFDLGAIQRDRGDLNSAEKSISLALEIDRRLGRVGEIRRDLSALALTFGRQGRLDEAAVHLEEALAISKGIGDPLEPAYLYLMIADYRRTQGLREQGRDLLERARALFAAQKEHIFESLAIAQLATLHRDMGDVTAFDRLLRDAIELGGPLLDSVNAIDQPLDRYGRVLLSAGALDTAERVFEANLRVVKRTTDRAEESNALLDLGQVQRVRGKPEQAKRYYEEALSLQSQLRGMPDDARALFLLATVEADLGHTEESRKALRAIVATSSELGADEDAAYAELDTAQLDIELDRLDGLEPRVRRIAESFEQQQNVYGQSYAGLVLAQLERERGSLTEATGLIRGAMESSRLVIPRLVTGHKGQIRELVAIEAARVFAGAGDAQGAREQLEFARTRARQLGDIPLELETRLAEGEVELLVGTVDSARNLLLDLANESRARGFVRIARKAESFLREPHTKM